MPQFTDFMAQHLTRGGYTVLDKSDQDVFAWSPLDGKPIWVCYLDSPLEPEQIRRSFEFKGHILYVVDDKLIPQDIVDRESTPMWLRVIHGLYFGRVYTWNGRFLYGLHFDYDNGVINESGIIIPDRLLLIEEGTWLRGWTGNYRTVRFYEKTWWTANAESFHGQYTQYKQQREQQERQGNKQAPPKQDESSYYGSWWRGQYDPNSSEYRERQKAENEYARQQWNSSYQQQQERAQRQKTDASGWSYDPNDWPNGNPPPPPKPPKQRDFKAEFKACKSEAEAKKLYRAFVREFHPDFNQEKRSAEEIARLTEIVKQINVSWEYMQGWWS